MKKNYFVLIALISVNTLFPINIAEELEEIRILQENARAKYVYSWFALGSCSLIAARFIGNHAAILEQELKEKWFWNHETQQEELPADTDQTTCAFWRWGKKAATFTGCLALIWGIKQGFHVTSLRMYIKLKETVVKAAQEQQNPGFQRWRTRNPYGSYAQYEANEKFTNFFFETIDPIFKQWRRANPNGSYEEYCAGGCFNNSAPQPHLDNYYTILGVEPTATNAQIKKAYLALAKENHPSTTRNTNTLSDEERTARETKFKDITDAYDTLKNPILKAVYDRDWVHTKEHERRAHVMLKRREQTQQDQEAEEFEVRRKAEKN